MRDRETRDVAGAARLAAEDLGPTPGLGPVDFDAVHGAEREAIRLARSIDELPDALRLAMRLSVDDATPHDLRILAGRAIVLARRRTGGRGGTLDLDQMSRGQLADRQERERVDLAKRHFAERAEHYAAELARDADPRP